jgi:hypothetical protein
LIIFHSFTQKSINIEIIKFSLRVRKFVFLSVKRKKTNWIEKKTTKLIVLLTMNLYRNRYQHNDSQMKLRSGGRRQTVIDFTLQKAHCRAASRQMIPPKLTVGGTPYVPLDVVEKPVEAIDFRI